RGQLVPCYKHRRYLARQAAPGWVPDAEAEQDDIPLGELGGDYAWQAVREPTPQLVRQRTEVARMGYYPPLQDLQIVDLSDRAMHDLLDLCRRHEIPVVLLLSPDGRE